MNFITVSILITWYKGKKIEHLEPVEAFINLDQCSAITHQPESLSDGIKYVTVLSFPNAAYALSEESSKVVLSQIEKRSVDFDPLVEFAIREANKAIETLGKISESRIK